MIDNPHPGEEDEDFFNVKGGVHFSLDGLQKEAKSRES